MNKELREKLIDEMLEEYAIRKFQYATLQLLRDRLIGINNTKLRDYK